MSDDFGPNEIAELLNYVTTQPRYYDPEIQDFLTYAKGNCDYGVQHDRNIKTPSDQVITDGAYCTRKEPISSGIGENRSDFLASADLCDYIIVLFYAGLLFNAGSYDKTTSILVDLMGAWDSGYIYGRDHCFRFQQDSYPHYIEFYVSPRGRINQIKCIQDYDKDCMPFIYPIGDLSIIEVMYKENINNVNFDFYNPQIIKLSSQILLIGEYFGLMNLGIRRFHEMKNVALRKSLMELILQHQGITIEYIELLRKRKGISF